MKPFGNKQGAHMKADLVDRLQDLIETNIDSSNNLADAADDVKDPTIAQLFRDLSRQRSLFAEELKRLVRETGEEPRNEGTLRGAAHKAWLNIRAALNNGDNYVMLIEAEREEDRIKHAYEDMLDCVEGTSCGEPVHRQYRAIVQQHNAIRELRDSWKDRKAEM